MGFLFAFISIFVTMGSTIEDFCTKTQRCTKFDLYLYNICTGTNDRKRKVYHKFPQIIDPRYWGFEDRGAIFSSIFDPNSFAIFRFMIIGCHLLLSADYFYCLLLTNSHIYSNNGQFSFIKTLFGIFFHFPPIFTKSTEKLFTQESRKYRLALESSFDFCFL